MRSFFKNLPRVFSQESRFVSTKASGADKLFLWAIAEKNTNRAWTKTMRSERESGAQNYLELRGEAEGEISQKQWLRAEVVDGEGRPVFVGPIPSIFSKSLLLEGGDQAVSKPAPVVSSNKGMVQQLKFKDGSVITLREVATSDQDLVDEIVLKKYSDEAEEQTSMIKNMNRMDRDNVALISSLQIDLNLREGNLTIANREEVKDRYLGRGGEERDFEYVVNGFVRKIVGSLAYVKDENGIIGDYPHSDEGLDEKASALLRRAKNKIYRAHSGDGERDEASDSKKHLVNSPFRHDDILSSGGSLGIFSGSEFADKVGRSLLINAILEDAAKEAYGEEDFNKFFQQMELSPAKGSVAFPRDYSISYGDVFHQTDARLARAISDSGGFLSKKDAITLSDRLSSHQADMKDSGFEVVQDIPFDAKGGNMMITQSADGKKVLLATVSDSYFTDKGEFVGGYVLDENGAVKEESNSALWKLLTGDKYPKFRQQIVDWGKSIGCDEVVVLDRNMEDVYKGKFKQLYHLDLFCGVLPGGCVAVNPEAITEENFAQLKQVFGEDKLIHLSQKEHKELCANFVVFDRLVVMSSPETPQSFVDKMNEAGFDVYVPSIYLTTPETQKSGWLAGIRCLTNSTEDSRELEIGEIELLEEGSKSANPLSLKGAQKVIAASAQESKSTASSL